MGNHTTSTLPASANVVRSIARTASVFILAFWGYFIIAHIVGDAGRPSRPLVVYDYIGLAAMGLSLLGLASAWKWEPAGAALTIVAVVIGAVVNWRSLMFPATLIPITAVMFLSSWWLSRGWQHGNVVNRANPDLD
jgi:hypothetical protein